MEQNFNFAVVQNFHVNTLVALAISKLGCASKLALRWSVGNPVDLVGNKAFGHKHTFVPVGNDKFVVCQILFHNKPTALTFRCATKSQATALTKCVVHQANVLAHHFAIHIHNVALLVGKVVLQKLPKIALSNKANTGGILLFGIDKAKLVGNFANFRLVHVGKWKQNVL